MKVTFSAPPPDPLGQPGNCKSPCHSGLGPLQDAQPSAVFVHLVSCRLLLRAELSSCSIASQSGGEPSYCCLPAILKVTRKQRGDACGAIREDNQDPGEEAGEKHQARELATKNKGLRSNPKNPYDNQVWSSCTCNPALRTVETGGLLVLAGCQASCRLSERPPPDSACAREVHTHTRVHGSYAGFCFIFVSLAQLVSSGEM